MQSIKQNVQEKSFRINEKIAINYLYPSILDKVGKELLILSLYIRFIIIEWKIYI